MSAPPRSSILVIRESKLIYGYEIHVGFIIVRTICQVYSRLLSRLQNSWPEKNGYSVLGLEKPQGQRPVRGEKRCDPYLRHIGYFLGRPPECGTCLAL